MSTAVIFAGDGPFPQTFAMPIIETADTWEDDWAYQPDLELVSLSLHASSTSVSQATFRRRYGNLKQPYETAFSLKNPVNGLGSWVRVSFVGDDGLLPQFVGRVDNEGANLAGTQDIASGMQQWVASGGLRLLLKQTIHEAYFIYGYDDDDNALFSKTEWIPAMNKRDKRGLLVGNRSDDPDENGIYAYGGDSVWTHRDYLDYLIANFIQQYDSDTGDPIGPLWTRGGQLDAINSMTSTIDFPQAGNIAELLRMLIPVKYGLDFQIVDTDDGFEITVFALASETMVAGGVSLPANPNLVTIDRTGQTNLVDTNIVTYSERRVDSIRVVGKRIVVCGTLEYPSLRPRWSSTLETAYLAEEDDDARKKDKYRLVYQQYGAPDGWDLDGGRWSVYTDLNGVAYVGSQDFQTVIRATLPWLPMKEGFDYSTDPPTDNSDGDIEPEIKGALAWIRDTNPDDGGGAATVQCDLAGIHVSIPNLDWGVFLNASPNHLLAINAGVTWTDDQLDTTDHEPRFDYAFLAATIAIESDHRLQLGFEVPAELAAGDGSEMTLVDEEAECWVLLPETQVDVLDGTEAVISPNKLVELRNDSDRLSLLLAGAVSRYALDRTRAVFGWKGFMAWGYMLGSILTVYQDGDASVSIGSPITSMEWTNGPSPMTTMRTGYV